MSQLNTPVSEDFSGFAAPSTWGTANPAANQLDSDIWAFSTTSATNTVASTFGLNYINGRGVSTGGVSTTGVYAIDTGSGVVGIGTQAGDADFTPGQLTIKLRNDTGFDIDQFRVEWDFLGYNDQSGRTASQLLVSPTDVSGSYLAPIGGSFITLDTPQGTLSWIESARDVTINAPVAPGGEYYLRWSFDDLAGAAGSGADRDELGIGNLRITPLGTILHDTFEWAAPVSDGFLEASSWNNVTGTTGGVVPGQFDTAVFDVGGAYTVGFDRDEASQQLEVVSGEVVFSSLTSATHTYRISADGDDPDDDIEVSGDLQVGAAGAPVVLIGDDATIAVGAQSGDDSTLLVADGSLLAVGGDSRTHEIGGRGGRGTLRLVGTAVGDIGGTTGTLNVAVSGFNATEGSLSVEDQAFLSAGNLHVATNTTQATGQVSVAGAGATIAVQGDLMVGSPSGGMGRVDVESGGQLEAGAATTIGATGTVNVGLVGAGVFVASGPVTVDGGALHFGSDGGFDYQPDQTLTISGGGQTTFVGSFSADSGMTINVVDGTLDVDGVLTIDDAAVDVAAGATFGFEGLVATGGATLTTAGALFFGDGVSGSVDGASQVVVGGNVVVGSNTASSELIVSGAGSRLEAGVTNVGQTSGLGFATPLLRFTDGATGELASMYVGVTNAVVPGFEGARLEVSGGSQIDIGTLHVASAFGAYGRVDVVGEGSRLEQSAGSSLFLSDVAAFGLGTLRVDDGGAFVGGDDQLRVGRIGRIEIGEDAQVSVGGALDLGGVVSLEAEGALFTAPSVVIESTGRLEIAAGTAVIGSIDIPVQPGGDVLLTGGSLTVDFFNGDLTNQGGDLAPGEPVGTTVVFGDYSQQAAATLRVDLGGTSQGNQYDFVSVSQTADIEGDLAISLVDGFTPSVGDTFTVLTASNLAGGFDNVASGGRLRTSDGAGSFVVGFDLDGDMVTLSNFIVAIDGDFNADGVVDAADYTVWRDNEGATEDGTALAGNGDGGVVGQSDYALWVANYGTSIPAVAVPEPSAALLLCGLSFLVRRRLGR